MAKPRKGKGAGRKKRTASTAFLKLLPRNLRDLADKIERQGDTPADTITNQRVLMQAVQAQTLAAIAHDQDAFEESEQRRADHGSPPSATGGSSSSAETSRERRPRS